MVLLRAAFVFSLTLALLAIAGPLSLVAHAVTTSWNTDFNGTFTSPANWDNGVPENDDTAVFSRGSAVIFPRGSIFEPPPNYVIDLLRVQTNGISFVHVNEPFLQVFPSLTVAHPVIDTDPGILIQGSAPTPATLDLGLAVNTESATIADTAGSQGTLNVIGNSFNVHGSNILEELIIGSFGAGALNVTGGGQVNLVGAESNFVLGNHAGSLGVVTIDGEGSSWSSNGSGAIGRAGSGSLTVTGGGDMTSVDAVIGDLVGSTGVVTIDGEGSSWSSSRRSTIGRAGSGALSVTGGGDITSLRGVMIGDLTGSSGIVAIDGPGSTWNGRESISVGSSGAGSLTISGGGQVTCGDGDLLTIDNVGVGRTGSLSVDGVGSKLTVDSTLFTGLGTGVGSGGAIVNVTGGGQVDSGGGSIGQGDNGTVLIDGAGSKWMNSLDLHVGLGGNGNGVLDINAGGEVSNRDADIGLLSASGTVTVDGSNSKWTNSGDLFLANGSVQITSGGQVTSNSSTIGDDQLGSATTALVQVNGVSSIWSNADTQSVDRNGMLSITGGGHVSSTHAQIDGGTVDVKGAGSMWTLSGDLTVENGTLNVTGGGGVTVSGLLTLQGSGGLKGTVKGNGNIVATIINGGVVSPGSSAGALHVDGSFFQAALGKLQIDLEERRRPQVMTSC